MESTSEALAAILPPPEPQPPPPDLHYLSAAYDLYQRVVKVLATISLQGLDDIPKSVVNLLLTLTPGKVLEAHKQLVSDPSPASVFTPGSLWWNLVR